MCNLYYCFTSICHSVTTDSSDSSKVRDQERALVYFSDVPTGEWPIGVDQPRRPEMPRFGTPSESVEAVTISSSSSDDDLTLSARQAKVAVGSSR